MHQCKPYTCNQQAIATSECLDPNQVIIASYIPMIKHLCTEVPALSRLEWTIEHPKGHENALSTIPGCIMLACNVPSYFDILSEN